MMTALSSLLTALDASPLALRRDDCGDHAIKGKLGHIFADGAGFLLCVSTGESARRWTHVKRRLAFCNVTQDGDDEGCLHLDRLPTPAEAELIREAVGIRRRRHLSPEMLARSRFYLERARSHVKSASGDRTFAKAVGAYPEPDAHPHPREAPRHRARSA
jgi:hypothetical protein